MSILKKIFYISLIALFISLLMWGVYNLSFKKDVAPPEQPKEIKKNEVPDTPQKSLSVVSISDEAVISPALTPDGGFIKYYSRSSGKVYQIALDGKSKDTISNQELGGLSDVLWSPDKTKVITKFIQPDGQVQFFLYDYNVQKGTAIKKNVDEISWQSGNAKIFYKYYDAASQKRSLNISNPDGSDWLKLSDIDYRNVSIAQIPQSGLVSFWNRPDSFVETDLASVPVISGEKKTISRGNFGADYLWCPDGSYVLTSNVDVRGGSKMQLGIMNYNGGEYKNLDVPTMVTKCVWSKDNTTVFCAIPGGIPSSAIMPNDYLENKFTTIDTFWKIDFKTGKKDRLIEAQNMTDKIDASELFLNKDESKLFFVNRIDGKIYKMDL